MVFEIIDEEKSKLGKSIIHDSRQVFEAESFSDAQTKSYAVSFIEKFHGENWAKTGGLSKKLLFLPIAKEYGHKLEN